MLSNGISLRSSEPSKLVHPQLIFERTLISEITRRLLARQVTNGHTIRHPILPG